MNPEPTLIDFGYTSHSLSRCGGKHWDEVNIINMTGRLYDPYLARVLNPDPFVSDPNNSQALNRYTYAMNNPFTYYDPNGKNVRKKFHQFRRWFRDEVYYPVVDFFNGTPNPETGEYEGGLAQQFQEWGVPSFEVGYNTTQGFYHSVNGNEPIYWEQSKVNSYEKAADVTYRAREYAATYASSGGGGDYAWAGSDDKSEFNVWFGLGYGFKINVLGLGATMKVNGPNVNIYSNTNGSKSTMNGVRWYYGSFGKGFASFSMYNFDGNFNNELYLGQMNIDINNQSLSYNPINISLHLGIIGFDYRLRSSPNQATMPYYEARQRFYERTGVPMPWR